MGCWAETVALTGAVIVALALGAGAYLYTPYQHLVPALSTGGRANRLEAILWVPAIRLIGDVAKMAGYPAGLLWRWRRGSTNA